jgi:hypothetical protein
MSVLPRSLRKYIVMPSGPGALWEPTLNKADAVSSTVIVRDKVFSGGY